MSPTWQRQVGNSVMIETIMTSHSLYMAVTAMYKGERITMWSTVVEAQEFGSGMMWDATEEMAEQIMVAAGLATEEAMKS